MIMTTQNHQMAAADAFTAATRELAAALDEITQPREIYDILAALASVQLEQGRIYRHLAAWHGQVSAGVHHDGEDERSDPEKPALPAVVQFLTKAADESRLTAEYLRQAQTANGIVQWRDVAME